MYIIHLYRPIYLQIYNEYGFKAKNLNDLFYYILYTHIYIWVFQAITYILVHTQRDKQTEKVDA